MTATPGDDSLDQLGIDPEEQLSQQQPSDTLDDRGVDDALDEGIVPPQKWSAGQGFGNTAYEEARGETLEQRIAQEEPEVDDEAEEGKYDEGSARGELNEWDENHMEDEDEQVGDERSGRLVAPDEGAHEDEEKDSVAYDVGIDGAGATAEEAAMHVISDEDA
jgi:Family of unknown function (DUF5709)